MLYYDDILKTTGTFVFQGQICRDGRPRPLDLEPSTVACCVDAFSVSMGALMYTSPVTAFIENSTDFCCVTLIARLSQEVPGIPEDGKQRWGRLPSVPHYHLMPTLWKLT
ncbi:hypothetical protein BC827DRAFT_560297 [Russula dissimulans]|nr:hypothetical protein BC827DRAFT_560297 [Russula dissimulans]